MRRITLTAFLFLAACGGDAKPDSGARRTTAVDPQAARQSFLMRRAALDVIAVFAQSSSQDAIDSCLNAWVQDGAGSDGDLGPVYKPSADDLRAFLRDCLGAQADPSGLRRSGKPGLAALRAVR